MDLNVFLGVVATPPPSYRTDQRHHSFAHIYHIAHTHNRTQSHAHTHNRTHARALAHTHTHFTGPVMVQPAVSLPPRSVSCK